jgi:hypothetical protein
MTVRWSRGSSARGSFRAIRSSQLKAGRVLDLYARRFEGRRLHPGECVICADEKSQLQALARRHETVPAAPGRRALVEFEHRRGGTLAYLAAWDVHHARLFGRREPKTGIEPFGRLVEQVMSTEPYASAKTVFWIVDNGSSHAGQRSVTRPQDAYPNARLIHLPIHASWLNQIEIYVRHEAPCERRARTNNSHPCRLEGRPRADAAVRRSWGQPGRGIARRRREQPRQSSGRVALPDTRARASETERQSESKAVVEASWSHQRPRTWRMWAAGSNGVAA